MEELYLKYHSSEKVNTVKNKDLIFKFEKNPIRSVYVLMAMLTICLIVYTNQFLYFVILLIFIVLGIRNKLTVQAVYFDNKFIILKNTYKEEKIYYKNGINIYLNREYYPRPKPYLRDILKLVKADDAESKYVYYLMIDDSFDKYIIAKVLDDNQVNEIKKFIDNFYYDEDEEKKEQNNIRFQL